MSPVDSKCTTDGRIKVHHFRRGVFLTWIGGLLQGKSGAAAFVEQPEAAYVPLRGGVWGTVVPHLHLLDNHSFLLASRWAALRVVLSLALSWSL
jgi:hypothetical protein